VLVNHDLDKSNPRDREATIPYHDLDKSNPRDREATIPLKHVESSIKANYYRRSKVRKFNVKLT
jgi:hypothetical protein